jgi:hypothetical protein
VSWKTYGASGVLSKHPARLLLRSRSFFDRRSFVVSVALASLAGAAVTAGCQSKSQVEPLQVEAELGLPSTEPEPPSTELDSALLSEDKAPFIEYLPEGLSPLYEGFMADPQAIAVLRRALTGHLVTPVATLKVIWDPVQQHGTITLHVSEQDARFSDLADAVEVGAALPMEYVKPLITAVGAYRADLGARFDLRLLSFSIRVSWWDPDSGSHCTLGGASNDPEGSRMAPCFSCVHIGDEELRVCRTEDGVSGSEAARSMLANALRSKF